MGTWVPKNDEGAWPRAPNSISVVCHLVDCAVSSLGPDTDQLQSKAVVPISILKICNFWRALTLCLCGDQANTANRNPHIMSPALQHWKSGWQLRALQRLKRTKHGKYCVLMTVLAEPENRHLYLQLIRLTQLHLQMESPAPATTTICWTCVVILPLNSTTCMTYFVFSWSLDWKTIKTTSALASDWLRRKQLVPLYRPSDHAWDIRLQLLTLSHSLRIWSWTRVFYWELGSRSLKTKLPSDLGSSRWSPPSHIPCPSSSLS